MSEDPHALFDAWLKDAEASEPNDPNAMALATVDGQGRPSVRMVLLKGHDQRGFTFYTNLESRKGDQLVANPHAALTFHWKSLRRQVRIEGRHERVSDAEADAYFASRSRESQLGAAASDQSRPLDRRETFEERVEALRAELGDAPVPRPAHWHGTRVVPDLIEFWEDRAARLHHRRLFTRMGSGAETGWQEGLLYP